MRVTIEPYNPEWKTKFLEVQSQLQSILQDIPITSIEHVGSTAIPQLKAKPVLDIDIIIDFTSLEAARKALVDANYTDCGEMIVPGRYAFRQPGYGRFEAAHGVGRNGEMRYNTYLMIQGCLSLRNHLDVRKMLMEDDKLREEYSQVKTTLESMEFDNIGQYVSGKSDILYKILKKAGWEAEDLQSVRQVNS